MRHESVHYRPVFNYSTIISSRQINFYAMKVECASMLSLSRILGSSSDLAFYNQPEEIKGHQRSRVGNTDYILLHLASHFEPAR